MMEQNPSSIQNLQKLQKWLEYEISSSVLAAFSWFWAILLFIVFLAALIFIPLMLKILYQEKKYRWILSFIIFIIIPAAAIHFVNFFISPLYVIMMYFPLAAFFLYCFMLKLAVRGWINDYKFIHGGFQEMEIQ